jgi:citrate lyase beta subunit
MKSTDPTPAAATTFIQSDVWVPDIEPDGDNLTAALAYADNGFYVLPAKRDTKDPGSIVGKRWQDQSSRNPKVIAAWFAGTDHDIALHCGRSGVVVIDVDHPDKLPDNLCDHLDSAPYQSTRDTPGRGHYVFGMPPGRTIGNGKRKLRGGWGDVRGLNGVIIACPSHHSDGGEYRWHRTGAAPVLPGEIADLLTDVSPASDAATDKQVEAFLADHRDGDIPDSLLGPVHQLEKAIGEGESRHDTTASVTVWAMDEAAAGCYSAEDAAAAVKDLFINAVGTQRRPDDRVLKDEVAQDEWKGILAWAVGQASAKTPEQLDAVHAKVEKRCGTVADAETGAGIGEPGEGTFTDSGNATDLVDHCRDDFRYVSAVPAWVGWDGMCWRECPDDGAVEHRARTLAAGMPMPQAPENVVQQPNAVQVWLYDYMTSHRGRARPKDIIAAAREAVLCYSHTAVRDAAGNLGVVTEYDEGEQAWWILAVDQVVFVAGIDSTEMFGAPTIAGTND